MTPYATRPSPRFELRFLSLFKDGRGWAFPCDAHGQVDLDHLSVRARNNYFFAHSVIGREVTMPRVWTLG
jgi:hypothetical protein